jgi:hypothetical protein
VVDLLLRVVKRSFSGSSINICIFRYKEEVLWPKVVQVAGILQPVEIPQAVGCLKKVKRTSNILSLSEAVKVE